MMPQIDMPAGRALDALVAELLGDVLVDGRWHSQDDSWWTCEDGGPRYYSTDMQYAWRVIEHMVAQGFHSSLDSYGGDPWWAEFATADWAQGAQAIGMSAPHAVCLAALATARAGDAGREGGNDGR